MYLRALRPLDSLGYVVVALIGVGSFLTSQGISGGRLLFETFLIGEALMSSVFLLNNRFDYAIDRRAGSDKTSKNPIALGFMGLREAEALSLSIMLLGLVALYLWIGSAIAIFLYLLVWVVGLMYSAPPFRLKSHAGFDILAHGAVVLGLFVMGYSFANMISWAAFVFGIPFVMLSTIYELRNHLKDWAVDSSAGVRTSIAAFGLSTGRRLLWVSVFLFWLSVLSAGFFLGEGMLILVTLTILSYSFFITVTRSNSDFVFDVHLWMMGGVYSAVKLLVIAGVLKISGV